MVGRFANSERPAGLPRKSRTFGPPLKPAWRRRPVVAADAQPLDSVPLIRRRKRAADPDLPEVLPQIAPEPQPRAEIGRSDDMAADAGGVRMNPRDAPEPQRRAEVTRSEEMAADAGGLRMKPREFVQLAAVHVRIPEQLARG